MNAKEPSIGHVVGGFFLIMIAVIAVMGLIIRFLGA